MTRTVIKAAWTIAAVGDRQVPLPGHAVVVEDDRIVDVTRDPPADAETIDLSSQMTLQMISPFAREICGTSHTFWPPSRKRSDC